jgi:hypothetical protein
MNDYIRGQFNEINVRCKHIAQAIICLQQYMLDNSLTSIMFNVNSAPLQYSVFNHARYAQRSIKVSCLQLASRSLAWRSDFSLDATSF